MKTQLTKFALTASLVLAMTFTFGCSSSSNNDKDEDPSSSSGGGVSSSSGGNSSSSGYISSSSGGGGSSSSQGGNSSSSGLSSSSGNSSSSGGLSSSSISSSSVGSSSSGAMSGTFTDGRDGNTYGWVKIGTQTWMAQNLNYNAFGSKCGAATNALTNDILTDDDTWFCAQYGRLYDWETAIGSSMNCDPHCTGANNDVCPNGWRIPSNADWDALITVAGGSETAGTKLKAASGWETSDKPGTDNYGFSALPGGLGSSDGEFRNAGRYGAWWTATNYGSNPALAYYWIMYYDQTHALWDPFNKGNFLSVRCIKELGSFTE